MAEGRENDQTYAGDGQGIQRTDHDSVSGKAEINSIRNKPIQVAVLKIVMALVIDTPGSGGRRTAVQIGQCHKFHLAFR